MFTQALADLGWTEGRNVRMDLRFAGGGINRISALAQELVRLQPNIILANSTPAIVALQRETRTIPIVFANVADPLASGLVVRLNQPGENITGFANFEATLGGKWLELLSENAPGLKRAAIMFNPDAASVSPYMRSATEYIEGEGQNRKITIVGIDAAGNPFNVIYSEAAEDGKPRPVMGFPAPAYDALSATPIDA